MKKGEYTEHRRQTERDRELLLSYNMRVLRAVAREIIPFPKYSDFSGKSQAERQKLFRHYEVFKHAYPKADLVGAMLPFMNSNAERLLEETAILVRQQMERSERGSTAASRRSHARYQHEIESPRRKATRTYMRLHSEVVERLTLKLKEETDGKGEENRSSRTGYTFMGEAL